MSQKNTAAFGLGPKAAYLNEMLTVLQVRQNHTFCQEESEPVHGQVRSHWVEIFDSNIGSFIFCPIENQGLPEVRKKQSIKSIIRRKIKFTISWLACHQLIGSELAYRLLQWGGLRDA